LRRLDEAEIAELGIGRKFQKPTVFESHTVEDNILLAHKSNRRARASLFWSAGVEDQSRIDSILHIVRLAALRDRLAGSLSHGQKPWLHVRRLPAPGPRPL